jgi:hypothetical protein
MMSNQANKVMAAAAVFYAAAIALWHVKPAEEYVPCVLCFEPNYFLTVSAWEYACFVLLIIAVGVTIAALRLRSSSEPR